MFGLILAVLYIAYKVVGCGIPVETATLWATSFLWYWHVAWTCVFLGVVLLIFLVSGGITAFSSNSDLKKSGIIGLFGVTPLLLIVGGVTSALFLSGVHCIHSSIAISTTTGNALGFTQWDMPVFVIGCILYSLGIIKGIAAQLVKNAP